MRFRIKGNSKLKTFKRVWRSYNIYEKFISIALIFVIAYLGFDSARQNDYFLNGTSASGRYSEGIVGQFQRINPVFVDANTADRTVSNLVFSGVVKYDVDTGEMVEDLAKMHISEDNKTYAFRVKEGVEWHDGKPVTGDDLYYTFHDVIQNEEFPNEILKANFEGVEIVQVEPMKIEFRLPKPSAFFVSNLNVGILPKHILGEVPVNELIGHEFNREPVGSGPYVMTEPYQKFPDGRMEAVLTVNEDFYGDMPAIKDMRIVAYPSNEEMIAGRSALNAMDKVFADQADEVRNDERFDLYSYELPQYTALFLNLDSPILKDVNVRLGLRKAINKEELLANMKGVKPVDTPLMQLKQDQWEYQANVEEAQGALYDAQYRYENEGDQFRKDSDGNEVEVTVLAREFPEGNLKREETQRVIDYVNNKWEEIGVKVTVELLPDGEYFAALQGRAYDVALAGQSLGYNLDTYSYWHSSQAVSGLNLSNYRSFAADKLIEDIRGTFDEATEQEQLNDLAQLISEEVPAVFLYRPTYYYASDGKIQVTAFDNLVYPSDKFGNVSKWSLR